MPLNPGSSVSENIRELHTGKTYAHTAGKFGKERADRQAIAIAMETKRRAGRAAGGVVPHFDAGGGVDPVSAVISALQSGTSAGIGGLSTGASAAPVPGATNPAAPSSPAATAATNNTTAPTGVAPATTSPAGNQQIAPTGVVTSNAQTPTAGNAAVVQPMAKPLMNTGGVVPQFADGGFNVAKAPNLRPPFYARSEDRQLHVGPVLSSVPGRTDNHQVKVPAGSYVLPAQHMASMGHGNTLAGMATASKMFGMYGAGAPHLGHGSLPKPPKPMLKYSLGGSLYGYSEGGARGTHHYEPTDVDISGGEFVIPPWAIIKRYGSLKNGHAILDRWVMNTRAAEIKTQKNLPPPAKK